MAKQSGIIKLEGTIGDISFYKSQDGLLARSKGGVSADRIQNDPSFQRTRENMDEFGRAGAAGKLLRMAFRTYLQNAADNRMVSRLTKAMTDVIKADATNTRGQRNVLDGELEMLEGFEFNNDGKLSATVYTSYTATIDRVTGMLKLNFFPFSPANAIAAPEGATHLKFISCGASIDFEGGIFESGIDESLEIEITQLPVPTVELVNSVTPNNTHPLFLVLGIEFYQKVNGVSYPLKSGRYNPLALVKVSGV
jgi:hypothetical protein